jgi:hypothetical protein
LPDILHYGKGLEKNIIRTLMGSMFAERYGINISAWTKIKW